MFEFGRLYRRLSLGDVVVGGCRSNLGPAQSKALSAQLALSTNIST